MATTKPRITISLEPEQYALLQRLSSLKGGAKSTIITDVLGAAMPALQRTADLLEAMERAKRGDYLDDFVASLDKAEQSLAPLLAAALEQMSLPLAAEPPPSNTGVTPSQTRTSSAGRKGSKAPSRGASKGDTTDDV